MIINKESSFTHLDRDNLMDDRLTVAKLEPSKSNANRSLWMIYDFYTGFSINVIYLVIEIIGLLAI